MSHVLFFDQNLNERGTSVATYDYAVYNELLLDNKSTVVSLKSNLLNPLNTFTKVSSSLDVILVDTVEEIYDIDCDYFYNLKFGVNDGILHPRAQNLVHTVFPVCEPHGDKYVYVSDWLARLMSKQAQYEAVPHIVALPNIDISYREHFNLQDKLVFGWYGGNNFDIQFARNVVKDVAKRRPDIVFLFMNCTPFTKQNEYENIIFVEGTTDLDEKTMFINTCDAMLHGRQRGETFGLAIAEFSLRNKPIITYWLSPERSHIDILGKAGIYYSNYTELFQILMRFDKAKYLHRDINMYKDFNPGRIMERFKEKFL